MSICDRERDKMIEKEGEVKKVLRRCNIYYSLGGRYPNESHRKSIAMRRKKKDCSKRKKTPRLYDYYLIISDVQYNATHIHTYLHHYVEEGTVYVIISAWLPIYMSN